MDAKDQAKLYLDGIRSTAKSANNILLIFLPILVFLFLENKKHFNEVEKLVTVRNNLINLNLQQDSLLKELSKVDTTYASSSYYNEYISGLESKAKAAKAREYFELRDSIRRKSEMNVQEIKPKIRAANDSLQKQLDNLVIPVELPFIKRTEELSIRSLCLITMLIILLLVIYVYRCRERIGRLTSKFLDLQKAHESEFSGPYNDFQMAFPFWMFPTGKLNRNFYKKSAIAQFLGMYDGEIYLYNWTASIFWFGILAVSFSLWRLNWDVNFKVFHRLYSCNILLCNVSFLIVIVLLVSFIRSGIFFKGPLLAAASQKKSVISRGAFIKWSIGFLLLCVVIEPVVAKVTNGSKWFQRPRYKRKKNKGFILPKPGLYSSGAKVYFFSRENYRKIFNTVVDAEKFYKQLKPAKYELFFKNRTYMRNIAEPDILAFVNNLRAEEVEEKRPGGMHRIDLLLSKKFELLDLYADVHMNKKLSPEFMDTYTRLFKSMTKSAKETSSSQLIRQQIADAKIHPESILPKKYQRKINVRTKDDEAKVQIQRDLLQQFNARSERWLRRLT